MNGVSARLSQAARLPRALPRPVTQTCGDRVASSARAAAGLSVGTAYELLASIPHFCFMLLGTSRNPVRRRVF